MVRTNLLPHSGCANRWPPGLSVHCGVANSRRCHLGLSGSRAGWTAGSRSVNRVDRQVDCDVSTLVQMAIG